MTEQDANIYVVEQVEVSSDSDLSSEVDDVYDLDEINDSINDINELDRLLNSTLKKSGIDSKI